MPYTITQSCNGCQACRKLCPVDAISGEKKGLHTIDGPQCIECGACGRVCSHQAVLDRFGNSCTMVKRSQWKKPRVQDEKCMSCAICIDACPVNGLALSFSKKARDPHGYPTLKDEKTCIGCGFCALECPVDAIVMQTQ
ncbi:MAG TPA: 4Fe-4S binding protein [Deltaproteobacteria bacterium]|nr:4Fe-4S binding protein [Deltaproteobacteria bacterium]